MDTYMPANTQVPSLLSPPLFIFISFLSLLLFSTGANCTGVVYNLLYNPTELEWYCFSPYETENIYWMVVCISFLNAPFSLEYMIVINLLLIYINLTFIGMCEYGTNFLRIYWPILQCLCSHWAPSSSLLCPIQKLCGKFYFQVLGWHNYPSS